MISPAAPLPAFSAYGIELEYMIVDGDSLAVLPIADTLLGSLAAGRSGDSAFGWSNELVLHLLEVKNLQPSPSLNGLAQGFQAEVARANEMLRGVGARLMPGGMHPWMNPAHETRLWPHRDAAIYRAYDRIFDCRAHGWANIQSMQLNLPFADDGEFARLHAAVRLLLPILPALAASSPIADGRLNAEMDFRMESYRRHAARKPSLIGRVIPDNASTLAAYREEVLQPMYEDVAPLDPDGVLQEDWLNARGAIPRFNRHAIEIRVIDMQECPDADLGIAGLAGAAARALYDERWSSFRTQQGVSTEALADILVDCVRDADLAVVDDPFYLALLGFDHPRCEARELWQHLFDACADDIAMPAESKAALNLILERGTLARRIIGAVGTGDDKTGMTAVYRELCDCLADGHSFTGPP